MGKTWRPKMRRLPYTEFLPTVVAINAAFTLFVVIIESGRCDYSAYPNQTWHMLTNSDIQTAYYREQADLPLYLAYLDIIVGICAVMAPGIATALGDLVPGVLIIVLVVVRVHSMGVFGCYNDDMTCCPAMQCPLTSTTSSILGCGEGDIVYWRDANNYCPIPLWFTLYKNKCEQLAHAHDVVPCYLYGCEYDATPLRYVATRVWAILSALQILGIVKDMIVINLLKAGSIKVILLKKKS